MKSDDASVGLYPAMPAAENRLRHEARKTIASLQIGLVGLIGLIGSFSMTVCACAASLARKSTATPASGVPCELRTVPRNEADS